MTCERGLAALASALAVAPNQWRPQRVASPFDFAKLFSGAKHIFPLFSEHAAAASLHPTPQIVTAPRHGGTRSHRRKAGRATGALGPSRSAQVPEVDAAEVEQRVSSVIASVLGSEVSVGQPLMEAGLDSLGATTS